jgi:DNA replication protein DnaC
MSEYYNLIITFYVESFKELPFQVDQKMGSSPDKQGADLLFQVVAARYEVGSIVITTNRPFREWGKILDVDNTLATALIDRLMHHGEGIVIEGDSYRMRDKDPDSTDK